MTLTARNQLVALPIAGGSTPLAVLPTVQQPDAVAVDSALGTVAVTGRAAGVLQLIGRRRAASGDESARAALRRVARTAG